MEMNFSAAAERARHVRDLYRQLEEHHHGSAWTPTEMMVGYLSDVGELGRLVMGAGDRWMYGGDLAKDLKDKLGENLWWLFVLAERLDVDLAAAFGGKMDELDRNLAASVERIPDQP